MATIILSFRSARPTADEGYSDQDTCPFMGRFMGQLLWCVRQRLKELVGAGRFELPTPCSRSIGPYYQVTVYRGVPAKGRRFVPNPFTRSMGSAHDIPRCMSKI